MKKIYDISVGLSPNVPIFPGDPNLLIERVKKIEAGDGCNVTRLGMGVHTATHIDAPYHFVADGRKMDQLDLSLLMGSAQVVWVESDGPVISRRRLMEAAIPEGCTRLLLKTANSEFWNHPEQGFREDFAALSADGACCLVERGIQLVGIDYLSIAPFHDSTAPHLVLLQNNVIVIEGLDLRNVEPGDYELICLPLKLMNAEGAPARAALIKETDTL